MIKITLLAILVVFMTGCRKDQVLEGSITGKVELSPSVSPEGVSVLLENGQTRRETVVHKSGIFRFDNVKEGYYDLTFSHEGYGTRQIRDFYFIGLGRTAVIERTVLDLVHDFDFLDVHLTLTRGVQGYTVAEGYFTSAPGLCQGVGVNLYLDKDTAVSNFFYTYSTDGHTLVNVVHGDTLFLKAYMHDLPEEGKWYVGIYNYDSSDKLGTLRKAFETIQLTVQ